MSSKRELRLNFSCAASDFYPGALSREGSPAKHLLVTQSGRPELRQSLNLGGPSSRRIQCPPAVQKLCAVNPRAIHSSEGWLSRSGRAGWGSVFCGLAVGAEAPNSCCRLRGDVKVGSEVERAGAVLRASSSRPRRSDSSHASNAEGPGAGPTQEAGLLTCPTRSSGCSKASVCGSVENGASSLSRIQLGVRVACGQDQNHLWVSERTNRSGSNTVLFLSMK